MLIPKESDDLLYTGTTMNVSTQRNDELDHKPPEDINRSIASRSEEAVTNGTAPCTNGEARSISSGKCMNILQNIIIKRDGHDHYIQMPAKRESDEDPLNNRIKIPRTDVVDAGTCTSPIKEEDEELLSVKSEIIETSHDTGTENEPASQTKAEVHTCFLCNMVFMETNAFTKHSKECGKAEQHYTGEGPQSSTATIDCRCPRRQNYSLQEQLRRLIEKVRDTPILYDDTTEGYNNIQLKDHMWSEIAVDCNFLSGSIAHSTWRKLFLEFVEALQKRQIGTVVAPHRFEQEMQFILPFIENAKLRIMHRNYPPPPPAHTNYARARIPAEVIEDIDDAQSVVYISSPPKQRNATPFVMRQVEVEPPVQLPQQPLPRNPDRATDLFFMSMCESVKALPVHLQLQVKRKVFDAIVDAEEIDNRVNHIRNEPFSPPPTPGENQFQY